QRTARFDAAHTRNLVEQPRGSLSLFVEAPTRDDVLIDGLIAAERRLNRVLGRHIGTHTHVGQQGQALKVVLSQVLGTADGYPTSAIAADAIGLRETTEGQTENVITGEAGGVVVHSVVKEDLFVDLVAE